MCRTRSSTTAGTGTTSSTRSTAWSSRSTRWRCSAGSAPRPRAALGDRLQVPAEEVNTWLLDGPGRRRPHRSGDAVRRGGARRGGRLHGLHGHAAQREAGGREGRPHRGHGRAAQGRGRHPRDRRAGRRPARRQRARVRDADALPRMRHPLRRAPRATPTSAAPTLRSCPAPLRERVFHVAGRGAFDIEVLGYEAAIALLQSGLLQDKGDIFHLTEEALSSSAFFTKKDDTLSANGHKLLDNLEQAAIDRSGACSWPSPSAMWVRPQRRRWPASSIAGPHPRYLGGRAGRGRRHRTYHRRFDPRVVRRRLAPRGRREVAIGRRHAGRRGARRGGPSAGRPGRGHHGLS